MQWRAAEIERDTVEELPVVADVRGAQGIDAFVRRPAERRCDAHGRIAGDIVERV